MTLDSKDKLQLERILLVCTDTLSTVKKQPSKVEVENMVMKGIKGHEKEFHPAAKQKDSRALKWAKILIPAFVALSGGGALINHFLG